MDTNTAKALLHRVEQAAMAYERLSKSTGEDVASREQGKAVIDELAAARAAFLAAVRPGTIEKMRLGEKIKPLVWTRDRNDMHWAYPPVRDGYVICRTGDQVVWRSQLMREWNEAGSLEEAQAAAQAHYERETLDRSTEVVSYGPYRIRWIGANSWAGFAVNLPAFLDDTDVWLTTEKPIV